MDPELPAVLLMGGGEGMGPVKKTAKALGESLFDKEHDKPSCYSCSADSLSIFFALSGGTSTIAEALIRGLPIILNDFIPGQVCDEINTHELYTILSN